MTSFSRTTKAGFLALGSSATVFAAILVAAILSRTMSMADYAAYRQTFLTYQLVAPLLGLGLPAAVLYFFPREPSRRHTLLSEMLLLLGGTGLCFMLFFWTGGSDLISHWWNNPRLKETLPWFAVYPLLALPLTLVPAALVAIDRSQWTPAFSFLSSILTVGFVMGAIFFVERSPLKVIQAQLLATTVLLLVISFFTVKIAGLPREKPTWTSFKSICSYAVPLSIASVIATLNKNVDTTIVSMFHSPEEAAVFMNGAMEIPFINIVTGSVSGILAAEFSRKYQEGKHGEILEVWKRSGKKCAYVLIPIASLLFAFAPEVMSLLYGTSYSGSATPFRIYLLLIPFRILQGGLFLRAAGKSKIIFCFAIVVTVVNLCTSLVFVPLIGVNGAAWATVLSVGVFGFPFGLWLTQRFTNLEAWRFIPVVSVVKLMAISIPISFALNKAYHQFILILKQHEYI